MNNLDDDPPEINIASSFCLFRMLVPLLAKQASPESAIGLNFIGKGSQVLPPLNVLAI